MKNLACRSNCDVPSALLGVHEWRVVGQTLRAVVTLSQMREVWLPLCTDPASVLN